MAIFLKPDVGWGQGCLHECDVPIVLNGDLNIQDVNYPITAGEAIKSFQKKWVKNGNDYWHSSHNSPHHVQYQPNNCNLNWTSPNGTEVNCISSNTNYTEGIFANINSNGDPLIDYCVSLNLQKLQCGFGSATNNIVLAFTSGLTPVPETQNNTTGLPSNQKQIIHTQTIGPSTFNVIPVNATFTPNGVNVFNQFWIYTTGVSGLNSFTTINDINITCTTRALTGITLNQTGNTIKVTADNESEVSTFVTYNWDFGDGNTSTAIEPWHTYQDGGTYTVTVEITDNNGCCATEDIQVIVLDCPDFTPDFKFTDNCPNFDFSVLNTNPNHTYAWSFGDGSTATGPTASHTYTENSTTGYTVTLTVTDECGDTFTVSKLIPVNCIVSPCVSGVGIIVIGQAGQTTLISTLFNNGTIPSTFSFGTRTASNLVLNLKGNLIIDVPTVLKTVIIHCDPGVKIEMTKIFILREKSVLKGCVTMWRGLYNGGFPLIILDSEISDAENGIYLYGTINALLIRDSRFYNNKEGIRTYNLTFINHQEISKTKFKIEGNFLPNYPSQQPFTITSGIASYGTNRVRVSSDSEFINLYYGIYTESTPVTIRGSKFLNCVGGISLNKCKGSSLIERENTFQCSGKGIELQNSTTGSVNIYGNTFTNVAGDTDSKGVDVLNFSVDELKISTNNQFNYPPTNFVHTSIHISSSSPKVCEIKNNDFNSARVSFNSLKPINRGVIQDNTFNRSTFLVNSCNRLDIVDNDFTGDYMWNHILSFKNSTRCYLKGNEFLPEITTVNNRGFAIENASENTYCCNILGGTTFAFTGESCDMSKVYNNTMGTIELRDGVISAQENAGNLWFGTSFGTILQINGSLDIDQLAFASPFTVKDEATHYPVNTWPLNWFRKTGSFMACSDNCTTIPYPVSPPNGGGGTLDPNDPPIISVDTFSRDCKKLQRQLNYWQHIYNNNPTSNTSQNGYFNIQSIFANWISKYGSAFINDCFDQAELIPTLVTDIDTWSDADDDRDDIRRPTPAHQSDYESLMSNIQIVEANIDAAVAQNMADDDPIMIGMLTNLSVLNEQMQVLADMIQSDIINRSLAFDAKINSLPIWMSKLIERKFVWHMEQKLLRSGSSTALTTSEWDQLRIIANTCPLEGGKGVYEAQALLSVIGEIDFPQYNIACQPVTPRNRSNDVGMDDIAKISPNPTTGIINIVPNIDGVYTISIQDISGRLLLTKENSGYLSLDLSTFMAGMYFFTITSDTKSQSGKVILVK